MKKLTLLSFLTFFVSIFLITYLYNWSLDDVSQTVIRFSIINSIAMAVFATLNIHIIYLLYNKISPMIVFLITFLIIFLSSILSMTIFLKTESIFILLRRNFFMQSIVINLIMGLSITVIQNLIFYFISQINKNQRIISEERLLRKEIEYKNALAKLNPHFLFNSLNTLVAIADNKQLIEKSLIDLSEILRYSMDADELKKVPLSKEIEICVKYIEFQKLRFGENIDYKLDLNGDDFDIMPFIVQPLVENSIKHNRSARYLEIIIRTTQDEKFNTIQISDSERKIDNSMIGKGTGLKVTKDRVTNSGAEFIIEDGSIAIRFKRK